MVGVDIGYNSTQAAESILLTIHIFIFTVNPNNTTRRNYLVCLINIIYEVGMEELNNLMVWMIKTIRLLISLPKDKYNE